MLSDEESINGGEYVLGYSFKLPISESHISSAKIRFLIDDKIQVVLNETKLSEILDNNQNQVRELDLTKSLKQGINDFRFLIQNASFAHLNVETEPFYYSNEKWNMNPFGIIFVIDIQVKG